MSAADEAHGEDAAEVLYVAPGVHRHGIGLGMATTGSFARCGCGLLLIYRGSPSGLVGWHEATRRERRRFARLVHSGGRAAEPSS